MAEDKPPTADENKKAPSGAQETIGKARERLLPGGSMEAAARAIGVNAVDRDMLPSYGVSSGQQHFQDSPDENDPRSGA